AQFSRASLNEFRVAEDVQNGDAQARLDLKQTQVASQSGNFNGVGFAGGHDFSPNEFSMTERSVTQITTRYNLFDSRPRAIDYCILPTAFCLLTCFPISNSTTFFVCANHIPAAPTNGLWCASARTSASNAKAVVIAFCLRGANSQSE